VSRALVAVMSCALGCAGSPMRGPGPLRFHNQAPVTVVNDRDPIAAPESFDEGLVEYYMREDLIEPTRRALSVTDPRPAQNVNSLGEVPDSSWFTNRSPTPEQIRRGPGELLDRSQPWRVVGVKVGGAAIGITIKDAHDHRYVLKFDERGHAETESAADVIVQRLAWAVGYNVPDNQVVTFKRADLVLDREAVVRDRAGDKRPMTDADLEKYLAMAENEQGTYRALASRFIDGKIIGGVEPQGVRQHDSNDRVPHELRRDLRGQRLLWAWVNHVDLKAQNTLATFTDGKFVKWYTLDFGESLGVNARTLSQPWDGYRATLSLRDFGLSLVTLGLYVHPWENQHYPSFRGLGYFDSDAFDPATWMPSHSWRPIDLADRFDELWAAEILLRFTRAHIEAAVAAGSYSDPRTAEYVVRTLLARQRKIGAYAFSRVAPLTRVEAREQAGGLEVCFDDLSLHHAYGAPAETRYHASSFDFDGRPLANANRWTAATADRTCITGIRPGVSHDRYTIARIDVRRGATGLPPLFVHLAIGPQGVRVVGLDRR
jgi:hypothetical protein